MVKINNVADWVRKDHKKYIVARLVDGEWWFYDAWPEDGFDKALAQAVEVGGQVIPVDQMARTKNI